jgi:hypothetical protein
MAERLRTSILICGLVVLGAVGPTESEACSCMGYEVGFLAPSEVQLPANAVGLPWSGRLEWENRKPLLPPKEKFSVERRVASGWQSIRFDLRLLEGGLVDSYHRKGYKPLVLVVPKERLRTGMKYRFRYSGAVKEFPLGRQLTAGRQVVEVDVSQTKFLPALAAPTVVRGNRKVAPIATSTLGGSCAVRLRAVQVPIELRLPQRWQKWRNALLYTVSVEGVGNWRPDRSLCNPTPPGLSWVGQGSELLFASCGGWADTESGWHESDPEVVLLPRRYEVKFSAWLPGTPAVATASAKVDLSCKSGDRH